MRNKKSQLDRVRYKLNRDGFITRNECINLQYHKITRLAAIIENLRKLGWKIETVEKNNDTIYKYERHNQTSEVF